MRFLTSGESHGKCLTAIIEGIPSGVQIDVDFINEQLKKRQFGIARSTRQNIENDKVKIIAGIRFGLTTGAPLCLEVENIDFKNHIKEMSVEPFSEPIEKITQIRPGHADYAGLIKYKQDDIKNILERASARETVSRVLIGAVSKLILKNFGINFSSKVLKIGTISYENKSELLDLVKKVKEDGDSLGGNFEIIAQNVPIGLGSCMNWDKKLDGLIAQAIMSIQAIKSVEIGAGTTCLELKGSQMQDEIFCENGKIFRKTNNAGGIEGGISNGEDIVVKATVKPIPTIRSSLNSVDFATKKEVKAHFERSDICAVESASIVAENVLATVICNAFLEKFTSDNLSDIKKVFEVINA